MKEREDVMEERRTIRHAVERMKRAVCSGNEPEIVNALAQLRSIMEPRGIVVGVLRDRDDHPYALGAVLLPTERFGIDWRSAGMGADTLSYFDVVGRVHWDGRLEVVKNRYGRNGFLPGNRLPCVPTHRDRYLASEVLVVEETLMQAAGGK